MGTLLSDQEKVHSSDKVNWEIRFVKKFFLNLKINKDLIVCRINQMANW